MDVAEPLVLGRVGVARADVAGLEGLELLLRAEFVGLLGLLGLGFFWGGYMKGGGGGGV